MPSESDLLDAIRRDGVEHLADARALAERADIPLTRVLRIALRETAAKRSPNGIAQATSLLREAVHADLDTGGYTTGDVLSRLAKGPEPQVALELLDLCMSADLVISMDRLGDIADAFADKARADLVLGCFDYLARTKQEPNAFLWSALIKAHQLAGNADEALASFRATPQATIFHLSPLIDALIANQRIGEAMDELARFEQLNPGEPNAPLLGRLAGAIGQRSCSRGVDLVLEKLAAGVVFKSAMVSPLSKAIVRQQDHLEALRLFEGLTAAGVVLSDRNRETVVSAFRNVNNAGDLLGMVPRLVPLLRTHNWGSLFYAAILRSDFDKTWLQVVRAAGVLNEAGELQSVVDGLHDSSFTRFVDIAVRAGDRGSLRWLFRHRSNPDVTHYQIALELAENSGDAELGRELVKEMFERGVMPDRKTFLGVAASYRGSLGGVRAAFAEKTSQGRGGNPKRLARMLIASVLQTYAATNQANQFGEVLGKFAGWPPLVDWSLLKSTVEEVARRRPRDLVDALVSLTAAVGPMPEDWKGLLVLEVARTGDVTATQALVRHFTRGDAGLTAARAALLRLADEYYRMRGDGRGHFRNPPTSHERGDDWLPDVRRELRLLANLRKSQVVAAQEIWRGWPRRTPPFKALPLDLTLRYLQAAGAAEELATAEPHLRAGHRDRVADIDRVVDEVHLRLGNGPALVARMVSESGWITPAQVKAYAEQKFADDADRSLVLARFDALSRSADPDQLRVLVTRAFTEVYATQNDVESIRVLFKELGRPTDWQAWAYLQQAYGQDAAAVEGVLTEMLSASVQPHLRNMRHVVHTLVTAARFDDAVRFVNRHEAWLTSTKEVASLLGQIVLRAASVDDLVTAEQVRDRILELPESVPQGAEAALHEARVRAGLAEPVVGAVAQDLQIKLDSFVQDVAHDLNNLLGPVWMAVSTARDWLEDGGKGGIAGALQDLTEVEEVLKPEVVERLEHWRQVADDDAASDDAADVGRIVRRVFALHRRGSDASGIRFDSSIGPGDHLVSMSPYQLDLVIRQLVDNAVKHLAKVPPDNRRVTVSASRLSDFESPHVRRAVRISVTDTGPGIAPAHRRAVFESGFSTRAERGVGRGLGLVANTLKACGASIDLETRSTTESEPGQPTFTQFNLTIPQAAG